MSWHAGGENNFITQSNIHRAIGGTWSMNEIGSMLGHEKGQIAILTALAKAR